MNITKTRSIWFTISAALVVASLIVTGIFGLNLGLDYTGGSRWHVGFEDTVSKQQVLDSLASQNFEQEPKIQEADTNEYLITLPELTEEQVATLKQSLTDSLGTYEEISYRKVDSAIGASFQKKAVSAIIATLIAIILFVAWSFRMIPKTVSPWRFGSVAIIALFHDVVIVLGVFVLLGKFFDVEIDLTFITALLATLGFSVNDTIVILDRVRENIRLQKSNETFEDTVEKSVQQTLARSINTSLSTLFPLLALLFLGAGSIFYFILALSVGIAVGTYSSIFLAAPMLVTLKNIADKK